MPRKRPDRPPVVGLTGRIGAGKSTVAQILREAGCVVADADAIVGDLLVQPQVIETLKAWWGEQVLQDGGALDRKVIAAIVFEDDSERVRLEQYLHPLVREVTEDIFDQADLAAPALVVDAPLLLESGMDQQCDTVLYIDAEPEVCMTRLTDGRGWTMQEIERRMAAQLPAEEKAGRAQEVILNNGTHQDLRIDVLKFLDSLNEES